MQNNTNKEKHLHTFLSKMLSFLKYVKKKTLENQSYFLNGGVGGI